MGSVVRRAHSRHQELKILSAKIPAVLEPQGLHRDDGKPVFGMTLTSKGQTLV